MPMKAAVLRALGKPPRFEEFPDPKPSLGEVIVHVKAASLKNIDKIDGERFALGQPSSTAGGMWYRRSRHPGRWVFCGGSRPPYGMMAERTVVSRQPHHLRALPRACETEGRGALLGHSTSEGKQDRADDGARLNVDMKKTNWGWREADVDVQGEHIELRYGDAETSACEQWLSGRHDMNAWSISTIS